MTQTELRAISVQMEAASKELPPMLTIHRAIWQLAVKSMRTYEVQEWVNRQSSTAHQSQKEG